MPLRLLERYYSVQGEGPRVGVPTQFVRFAGCNLRCPLWPCDTPYAIEPKLYRAEQRIVTPEALRDEIIMMRAETGANNVCLTGGEPLVQTKTDLNALVSFLFDHHFGIEMFSNGTIQYWPLLADQLSIVMDWKLPGSGEFDKYSGTVLKNFSAIRYSDKHSIKFTVAGIGDLQTAHALWHTYKFDNYPCQVFIAPVWNAISPAEVVDFIKAWQLPWRLSLQTHKYIYDPDARGI